MCSVAFTNPNRCASSKQCYLCTIACLIINPSFTTIPSIFYCNTRSLSKRSTTRPQLTNHCSIYRAIPTGYIFPAPFKICFFWLFKRTFL